MPETPTIDIPPTIPNRGLKVRPAISSPPGTKIVTSKFLPKADKFCWIIALGTLLMAGSPGG